MTDIAETLICVIDGPKTTPEAIIKLCKSIPVWAFETSQRKTGIEAFGRPANLTFYKNRIGVEKNPELTSWISTITDHHYYARYLLLMEFEALTLENLKIMGFDEQVDGTFHIPEAYMPDY